MKSMLENMTLADLVGTANDHLLSERLKREGITERGTTEVINSNPRSRRNTTAGRQLEREAA